MTARANKIRAVKKLLAGNDGYPRLFLHAINGHFNLHFELENCVRCLILSEAQAMKRIKEHRNINIVIYHAPGAPLPEWSKGLKASIAEILPSMEPQVVKWLTFAMPTLYDDQSIEDYSAKLTQEQKQIIADMSRIQRFLNHEL